MVSGEPNIVHIVVSEAGDRLLGAVLVGDVEDYGNLLQMTLNAMPLPEHPDSLILPAYAGAKPALGVDALPESAQICSCFDVTKGKIAAAVAAQLLQVKEAREEGPHDATLAHPNPLLARQFMEA